MSKQSVFGLNERIAGALSYAGVFVTGAIVFVMERENKSVRFHALQSLIWFGFLGIVQTIVGIVPILGWIVSGILGLITFVSWLYLMYTAYKGQTFKLPIVGDAVWSAVNK